MIEIFKSYVNENCNKCLNRKSKDDLCNIVITIDGKPNCCNKCFENDNREASK